jgi:hypothetical protein
MAQPLKGVQVMMLAEILRNSTCTVRYEDSSTGATVTVKHTGEFADLSDNAYNASMGYGTANIVGKLPNGRTYARKGVKGSEVLAIVGFPVPQLPAPKS